MLGGIFELEQLLVTCRIHELPRHCYLIGVLGCFAGSLQYAELGVELKAGDDLSWKGRKLSRAGKKKGEEKFFLTHLLYVQLSAEKRREYHICFNLLTEIFFSSVCRKSGRLFFITT